ncbi:TP901 family phage tail tape measure protein [Escherichia coli]|nr:TP901 family phage tail tape measure protein [Escherichia coli]
MDILYTVKSVTGALRRWVEANPELTGTLMKVAAGCGCGDSGASGTLAVALAAVLGPLAVIRLGFSVLGIKTLPSVTAAVTRTSNALSWLAGAPTGTAATRACFIGQRRRFTYCAVVVLAPHGITDGKCPEKL